LDSLNDEGTLTFGFFPSGQRVRMVVTLSPMHDEEFTKMASAGLASQFRSLDKPLLPNEKTARRE
jgi:hypothetical protein